MKVSSQTSYYEIHYAQQNLQKCRKTYHFMHLCLKWSSQKIVFNLITKTV